MIVFYFLAIVNFGNLLFCIYNVLKLSPILKDYIRMRTETKVVLMGSKCFIEFEKEHMGTTRMADNKEKGERLIKNLTKDIRSMYRTEFALYMLITYSGYMTVVETMNILEARNLL